MKENCECDHCECDKTDLVRVYFCPKCKSQNVGYTFGLKNLLGIIPRMQCQKCGFHSSVFPQWVVEEKKLNSANKKMKNKRSKK